MEETVMAKKIKKKELDRREFIALGPVAIPWIGVAWAAFTGATTLLLGATGRFFFPNVLFEPPQSFKAGLPAEYTLGKVDLRWKKKFGVWLVRDVDNERGEGFYALSTVCTHLGCTPNWLEAEQKFKCPCHGSGFRRSGMHFEGPAPRPLERYRVVFSEDGQILVDKSQKFQQEKGEWTKAGSFLALA
ncbi:MAG: ubiquinol-cytochrome c reductase iron-sulfur subunit [Planctomycetota bacterium]|nr:ubiquinol-cytochrome c reductase iron-sulfur subunit [Planctomycetota bacterium]